MLPDRITHHVWQVSNQTNGYVRPKQKLLDRSNINEAKEFEVSYIQFITANQSAVT